MACRVRTNLLRSAWQALREAAEAFSVPDRAVLLRTPRPAKSTPPRRRSP